MRRIVLIAFEGAATLDIAGPADVFGLANREQGGEAYRIEVASLGGGLCRSSSGVVISTSDLRQVNAGPLDTIIVVGGVEAAVRAAMANTELLAWIRAAKPVVERMSSVCTGAFLLAAAGLLDGRRATTHWRGCDLMAQMFPKVQLEPNAIFVRDGEIWTSAGVSTGIDMALAIVEEDHNRAAADSVAAGLVLYVRRPGFQSQFSPSLVAQLAGSNPLNGAVQWIRNHLDVADVPNLAHACGLSVRTLHRRCREVYSLTPAKLIERVRVEHARTLLNGSRSIAKELAARSGFANPTNMKRAFERELGMAPGDYQLLHSRSAAE